MQRTEHEFVEALNGSTFQLGIVYRWPSHQNFLDVLHTKHAAVAAVGLPGHWRLEQRERCDPRISKGGARGTAKERIYVGFKRSFVVVAIFAAIAAATAACVAFSVSTTR